MEPSADAAAIAASVTDPAAFSVVFDRHFAALHRWLRLTAGEQADDLAAETFVRAFAARARFRPGTAPDARAWLFAIALNLVRDEARRGRRRDALLTRLAGRAAPAAQPLPELPDPALHAALLGLRREEREVLLLVAWADLAYEDVAAVLGVPVGTVRSRLSRARAQLRDHLTPLEEASR